MPTVTFKVVQVEKLGDRKLRTPIFQIIREEVVARSQSKKHADQIAELLGAEQERNS